MPTPLPWPPKAPLEHLGHDAHRWTPDQDAHVLTLACCIEGQILGLTKDVPFALTLDGMVRVEELRRQGWKPSSLQAAQVVHRLGQAGMRTTDMGYQYYRIMEERGVDFDSPPDLTLVRRLRRLYDME